MVWAVPGDRDDARALAYRCAVRAAELAGSAALACRWPRAGLFAVRPDGEASLSLTHASSLVAAVAAPDPSAGPVGIDAEPGDRPAGAVRRILAPGEGDALFAEARAAELPPELAVWCAKEAVGKALGSGVTNAREWRLVPTGHPTAWRLDDAPALLVKLFPWHGSVLAVAFSGKKLTQGVEFTKL